MRKEYLEVGEIVTTHGIKGEVRLYPWCDPGDLEAAKVLYFDKGATSIKVQKARPHKNVYVIKLEGIDSPDEAVKLRGKIAYMKREDIPMSPGDFFIQDLCGLSVMDTDEGVCYGTITDVAQTGANDVYCVSAPNKEDVWIPAIKQVIIKVDLDEEKIFIRPMKGLFGDED